MGFVTLEDLQGNIELVVFPRTWDQFWQKLEVDNVVLVDGKVDAQSGDPKVLVDSVTTEFKTITSTEEQNRKSEPAARSAAAGQTKSTARPSARPPAQPAPRPASPPAARHAETPPPAPG
jgi:DNA polymerase-3 subunit alpha